MAGKKSRQRSQSEADGRTSGATLGFEAKLWAVGDKLRGHMDAAEYKHVSSASSS